MWWNMIILFYALPRHDFLHCTLVDLIPQCQTPVCELPLGRSNVAFDGRDSSKAQAIEPHPHRKIPKAFIKASACALNNSPEVTATVLQYKDVHSCGPERWISGVEVQEAGLWEGNLRLLVRALRPEP